MRGKLVDLHWTVQAQILRRGGLKSGVAVPVKDVDDRISALRAAAKASDAAARADGAKTAADRRGGSLWSPPAEFGDLDLTAAEHDLAELVKGPDRQWGREAHPGGKPSAAALRVPEEHHEYAARLDQWSPNEAVEKASCALKAYVRSRQAQDQDVTVGVALEEIASYGVGDVAEEASLILDSGGRAGHSHPEAEVKFGAVVWPDAGGEPGVGSLLVKGESWSCLDYREDLPMTEELAAILGEPEPRLEKRQCLLKSVAAALLVGPEVPAEADVIALAAKLRLEMANNARAAERALGPAPDRVSPTEHELRVHLHDALSSDHDKDFRVLACLPLDQLRARTLVVLRVDYLGRLIVETVTGEDVLPGEPRYLWTVLHRGHMRLARPPLDGTGASWLQDMVQSVGPCGDTPGWEFFLDRAGGDADTAPGEVSRSCRCCRATRLKTPARPRLVGSHSPPYLDSEDMSYARVGSVLPRVALAFEEREAANGYLDLPGRELILQEVCAGTAGITKALATARAAGGRAHRALRRPRGA
jgi:hypothetical protein